MAQITNLAEARAAIAAGGPGIYDMPNEVYHADPCPTPSLSASIAHEIRKTCPAKARLKHPRLNPDFEPENATHFDIGKAGHLMMLEPAKFDDAVAVIMADDYKTKAAQQAKAEAREAGKIPLLTSQAEMVRAMRDALMADPIARDAFAGGDPEVSAFWHEPDFNLWCRIRPDWVPAGSKTLIDYKALASVHPEALSKAVFERGYFQRAAFYLDGWPKASGTEAEEYWFVAQEKEQPYLVTVFRLAFDTLDEGRTENAEAMAAFATGLHTGRWPGYHDTATTIGMPPWAHYRLEDRRKGGLPQIPRDLAAKRMAEKTNRPL